MPFPGLGEALTREGFGPRTAWRRGESSQQLKGQEVTLLAFLYFRPGKMEAFEGWACLLWRVLIRPCIDVFRAHTNDNGPRRRMECAARSAMFLADKTLPSMLKITSISYGFRNRDSGGFSSIGGLKLGNVIS